MSESPRASDIDTTDGVLLGDSQKASGLERPESIDQLRQIVTEQVSEGMAIYPQGGRSALDYGGTPRSAGIALDLRSLDQVIDYPAADMTVTVEAGITIASLQQRLATEGQRLLVDVPHPEVATIGAVFATNTSGPRRFGAGRPRDQIIGVSFVTADGELVKGGGRVVKNVAGYDFPRLLTGSMGTLGVIAQMTVKVRPRPEASAIVWTTFDTIGNVAAALDALNTSGTRPMAIELLNHSAATSLGGPLGLPIDAYVLAIGYEDNVPSVAWQVERLQSELNQPESVISEDANLWSMLTAFQSLGLGPVTVVANLRPSNVARFVGVLDPGLWTSQAHAGSGIVRAHWLGKPDLEAVATEVDRIRKLAVHDGGNLIVSRSPAEWKPRLRVWGEPRSDWWLSERIRQTFDPKGLMNPGRLDLTPNSRQ